MRPLIVPMYLVWLVITIVQVTIVGETFFTTACERRGKEVKEACHTEGQFNPNAPPPGEKPEP